MCTCTMCSASSINKNSPDEVIIQQSGHSIFTLLSGVKSEQKSEFLDAEISWRNLFLKMAQTNKNQTRK